MNSAIDDRDSRGMRLAIGKTGLVLAAVFGLAGCVSLGGEVPDQLITLTADQRVPAGDIASGEIGNAIVILDPDADRRIDVARVLVQINDSTVAYLKDAVWVEKPARQFRRLLAETVRANSKRVVVEGSDFEVSGKTVVSGRLSEMGYDARVQAVIVRFDAIVEQEDGTVRSRRFESEIPVLRAKAAVVAPALNEAANEVVKEVANWLGE
ncbi:MAG: membrane integrity-associated transporter subunit PqiC [Sphingomonadaceae bacterium]|nr:membrane integrity-associated transporter subunit PqiC [Sphingomonadaceae bacterium]